MTLYEVAAHYIKQLEDAIVEREKTIQDLRNQLKKDDKTKPVK